MKLLFGVVGWEFELFELFCEFSELFGLFFGFKWLIKLLKNIFGVGVFGKLEDSFVCLGKFFVDLVGFLLVFVFWLSLFWIGDFLFRYCFEIFCVVVFGGCFCSIFMVLVGSDLFINLLFWWKFLYFDLSGVDGWLLIILLICLFLIFDILFKFWVLKFLLFLLIWVDDILVGGGW